MIVFYTLILGDFKCLIYTNYGISTKSVLLVRGRTVDAICNLDLFILYVGLTVWILWRNSLFVKTCA